MASKSLEDFGLTDEDLYEEKALPYWQQYDSETFMLVMRHELLKQAIDIGEYAKLIAQSDNILDTEVLGEITVAQATQAILRSEENLRKLTQLLNLYARAKGAT